MSPSSPTIARVVHRHRHGAVVLRDVPAPTVEVVYSDGGIVTSEDVIRLLGDRLKLRGLKFLKVASDANVVRWIGATTEGATVMGSLVLHAGVRADQLVCWAEIALDDEQGSRTAGGTPEEQILRQRLERIDALARCLIEKARVNPQAPVSGLVGELVRIVDQADG